MQRTENLPKRNIVEVYNGEWDGLWTRRSFRGTHHRSRAIPGKREARHVQHLAQPIHEDGVILRYGGPDIVNLHEVEWVELLDADDRTIRFAMNAPHICRLKRRCNARPENGDCHRRNRAIFQLPCRGWHPDSVSNRARPKWDKILQVFFDSCQYNTGLPASLFTKESLDDRWAKIGREREKEKKRRRRRQVFVHCATN